MLKKITFEQIKIGMYVHELCASWMSSPFWQKSFLIETQSEIDKIGKAQIREIWIDTSKGIDVELEIVDQAVPANTAQIKQLPTEPESVVAQASIEEAPASYNEIALVSLDAELGRAAKIVDKSKKAVCSMFNEARMGMAIEAEQAMVLVEEIAMSVMRNPSALIGLARLKTADDYTYMHSVAVCALMIALSRQMGLSDEATREAGLAGLLHDIGKMDVPPEILNKPGKLTESEFDAIKKHPAAGHAMLLIATGVGAAALDVCLHHHEKIDGSGYPEGLAGDQISMMAKMGAVCDVYDAITSNRPYKVGWCPAESLKKMSEWRSGHFDEEVFQAFVRSIGIYPVGTLVKLQSGRLGVVVEQQAAKSLLLPKIRLFFSTKSKTYIKPVLLDLSSPSNLDKIVSREDAATWDLKDVDHYWSGATFE